MFPNSSRKNALLQMCLTRWSQRICSWEKFFECLPAIIRSLEIIIGSKSNPLNEKETFDATSKSKALNLLKGIEDVRFIVGLTCITEFMTPLLIPTYSLQKKSIDVLNAYIMMDDVIKVLQNQRENMDNIWEKKLWPTIEEACRNIDLDINIPRRCGRMVHWNNVPGDNPSEFYRRAVAIPLLDGILEAMKRRFGADQKKVAKLLFLLPSNLTKSSQSDLETNLTDMLDHYDKVFFIISYKEEF